MRSWVKDRLDKEISNKFNEKANELRNINELLSAGMDAQIQKLQKNNHKNPFTGLELKYCIDRLEQELAEVKEAYEIYKEYPNKHNLNNLRLEFADTSNFSHMGILTADNLLKEIENDTTRN